MTQGQLSQVERQVCELLQAPERGALTDRQLLERFARLGDQFAFGELVDRHGAMVLGVCRSVVRDAHDAEDVFQATWLVTARKASAVSWTDHVGAWLHQVAYRLALKARAQAARRRDKERQVREMLPSGDGETIPPESELLALLQGELARLPEKYRSPLVLCYLEGKTNAEAAQALGCPLGSLSRRLAQARERLRHRLNGRGVAVSAGTLIALLAETAAAGVPATLRQTTIQAAVLLAAGNTAVATVASAPVTALVEGAIREMYLKSMKVVGLFVLTLALFGAGIGVVAHRATSAEKPGAPAKKARPVADPPRPLAPARTFKSNMMLSVGQLVESETAPRQLGWTPNPFAKKPVAIPAGANWFVQPIAGFGFGGGFGIGGNVGALGAVGFGGGVGALGMPPGGQLGQVGQVGQLGGLNRGGFGGGFGGGALGAPPGGFGGGKGAIGGGKRPAPPKIAPRMPFGQKLTGDDLKKLVAEMKKQSIPGLLVGEMELTDDDLGVLKQVTGLRTLLLRGGAIRISGDGLKHLKGLRSLSTLALDGTALADADLKEMEELKSLRRLHLGGSRIGDKGMAHLREMKKLRALRLTWTAVTGKGLAELRSVQSLEVLELVGEFTDADLEGLKDLTALKVLRLHQTKVTDAGLKQLDHLTTLKVLSIDAHFGWNGPFYGFGAGFGNIGGFGVGGGVVGAIGGGGALGGVGALGAVGGGGALGAVGGGGAVGKGAVGGGGAVGKGAVGGGGALGAIGGGGLLGVPMGGPVGGMRWFVPEADFTPDGKVVKLVPSPVTGAGLKHLKPLTGLVELNLGSSKLGDDDLKELAPLTNLKKLRVFAPQVTPKGVAHLKALKALEVLDVRGTGIATELAPLRALPKLRVVYVNLSPFSPKYKTDLAEARKALPRVTINPLWQMPAGMMGGFGVGGLGGGAIGGGGKR